MHSLAFRLGKAAQQGAAARTLLDLGAQVLGRALRERGDRAEPAGVGDRRRHLGVADVLPGAQGQLSAQQIADASTGSDKRKKLREERCSVEQSTAVEDVPHLHAAAQDRVLAADQVGEGGPERHAESC